MVASQSQPCGAHNGAAPVDLAKVKVGDWVTIRAEVTEVSVNSWRVLPPTFAADIGQWVGPNDIASHTPKALAVGDRVKATGWDSALSIVAIDDAWAWLRDGESNRIQMPLRDLERIS